MAPPHTTAYLDDLEPGSTPPIIPRTHTPQPPATAEHTALQQLYDNILEAESLLNQANAIADQHAQLISQSNQLSEKHAQLISLARSKDPALIPTPKLKRTKPLKHHAKPLPKPKPKSTLAQIIDTIEVIQQRPDLLGKRLSLADIIATKFKSFDLICSELQQLCDDTATPVKIKAQILIAVATIAGAERIPFKHPTHNKHRARHAWTSPK